VDTGGLILEFLALRADQGSSKIGSCSVCRVGEPFLPRHMWGGNALLRSFRLEPN
jgi:hypothetical protein